jgi:hypothetical protein
LLSQPQAGQLGPRALQRAAGDAVLTFHDRQVWLRYGTFAQKKQNSRRRALLVAVSGANFSAPCADVKGSEAKPSFLRRSFVRGLGNQLLARNLVQY